MKVGGDQNFAVVIRGSFDKTRHCLSDTICQTREIIASSQLNTIAFIYQNSLISSVFRYSSLKTIFGTRLDIVPPTNRALRLWSAETKPVARRQLKTSLSLKEQKER
jgi:hypothetical protein